MALVDMTVSEIESALSEFEKGYESSWYFWKDESDRDGETVDGLGRVKVIQEHGGGEGSGEHVFIVFKVQEEDTPYWRGIRYFKKEGYYASFSGTDWDGGFYEVTPAEHIVTIFERVSK